jgi:cytochrome P450
MPTGATDLHFDPFDPGPREHRPAIFAELRERVPVYRTDADVWVVSRFDDVKFVQSTPELFSSRPNPYDAGAADPDAEVDPAVIEHFLAIAEVMPIDLAEMTAAQNIVAADPPVHTRMRRIVSRGFTPARIAKLATTIDEIVDRCLADAGDLDGFDVIDGLAIPLPVEMIADILGIGDAHFGQVKQWSDQFSAGAAGIRNTAEGQLALLNALKEFSSFYVPLIEARRADPQDDVISAMVRAVDEDTLSTVETLMMAITMMVAGNETSTNLIGNTVVELYSNPDQLALLLDDPTLIPNTVEEANRLTAPIQFAFREATQDTEVAGTSIPKGAIIAVHMAAANRDAMYFDDPDRFVINRPRVKNLSFGNGAHFCLGAHLATQEVTTAIGKLLPHLSDLRLSDDPLELNPNPVLNGWQRVQLVRV